MRPTDPDVSDNEEPVAKKWKSNETGQSTENEAIIGQLN